MIAIYEQEETELFKTIKWWLRPSTLRERLWWPIRKRLHRRKQYRIERDYWKAKFWELENWREKE